MCLQRFLELQFLLALHVTSANCYGMVDVKAIASELERCRIFVSNAILGIFGAKLTLIEMLDDKPGVASKVRQRRVGVLENVRNAGILCNGDSSIMNCPTLSENKSLQSRRLVGMRLSELLGLRVVPTRRPWRTT